MISRDFLRERIQGRPLMEAAPVCFPRFLQEIHEEHEEIKMGFSFFDFDDFNR